MSKLNIVVILEPFIAFDLSFDRELLITPTFLASKYIMTSSTLTTPSWKTLKLSYLIWIEIELLVHMIFLSLFIYLFGYTSKITSLNLWKTSTIQLFFPKAFYPLLLSTSPKATTPKIGTNTNSLPFVMYLAKYYPKVYIRKLSGTGHCHWQIDMGENC